MDLKVESIDSASYPSESAFFFDLGDPECWLAAERVITTLGRPAPWIPVLSSSLPEQKYETVADWIASLEPIAATAAKRGLLELRPPSGPQTETRDAMLAATYAKQSGKTVAFVLAAMRQCWCAGRDLADHDTIALAGAAAEIHPNALAKALGLRSLAAELDANTSQALAAGVRRLPAVMLEGRIFHGDAGLDEAARAVEA